MKNRLMRLTLVLLTASAISLGLVGGLNFFTPPNLELAQAALQKAKPTLDRMERFGFVRSAAAADLDGKFDKVADELFGQPDFSTNAAPTAATADVLNQPGDLFVYDLTGQIFIADTANNRILIWDSVDFYENGDPADVVLGQPDFTTTDVLDPPTAAGMNAPRGITIGFDGLIYVSDTGNNRVLVFFPTNYDDGDFIPGESYPIFVDGQEADYALGQPNFASGTARPTDADTLSSPMGLVTDVNDNLVVADHGNNRVLVYEWNEAGTIGPEANWVVGQEISGAGNETFTFNAAPNPPTQRSMNGPTSVAADLLGHAIYVADTGNNRVLVFNSDPLDNVADGLIGQPDYSSNGPNNGGLSGSSLDGPTGLRMDAGNRLFVADTNNNRVLVFDRLNPDSVADEVIGQPDYVSNTANNGGVSAASLDRPTGIATDALFMDVYIADAGNNRALQYNQPLQNPVPVIDLLDPGTVPAGAEGFTLGIWGSGIISDTIVEINGVTRTTGSDFLGYTRARIEASEVLTTGRLTITLRNPAPGGGVSAPAVLDVYVPAAQDDLADVVLGQTSFTTNWGPWAPVRPTTLFEPSGMVVDPATGRIFVADTGNARVLSWPSQAAQVNGGAADLVIGKPDFTTYFYQAEFGLNMGRPVGLALDSQGNLYVAEAQESLVLIYTQPFTNGMDAALIIRELNNPLALALDSQDNLYVADTFNHRVLFYETPLADQDITPDRIFGQPDMAGTDPNRGGNISADTLHYPSGVALDAADNLYVSDSNNHRLLVYLAASGDTTADVVFGQMGDFTTGEANKGGISAESLNYPYGLLVDGFGNLYVADSDNNRVLGYAAPLATDTVADLVIGQSGSFARNGLNQGRTTIQGATAPNQGTLRGPTMVGLNADGDLFVADNGNNRILGFRESRILQVEWEIFLPNVKQ
ncbi:hypothetical protein GC175_20145 [bacterium]|nr:hypothetical protein [bacterium]